MNLNRATIKEIVSTKNRINKKGSYLLEATISLPILIIAVVSLALIIRIFAACEAIVFVSSDKLWEYNKPVAPINTISTVFLCKEISDGVEELPCLEKFKFNKVKLNYSVDDITDILAVNMEADFKVNNPIGINGKIIFKQGILTRSFVGAYSAGDPLTEEDFVKEKGDSIVIIFPSYGNRYHKPSCIYVTKTFKDNKKVELQKEEAKLKGYTPCLVCAGA